MKQVIVLITFLIVLSGNFPCEAKEWYETASFYQIYPQTFLDTGVNGEKEGFGDLRGIQQKLDYIEGLGFECIWLTPIFKTSYRSFGYDIVDYKEVDSRFGTNQDLKNLIDAVHAKGMKIILDFVPNHCSSNNEFFNKSINAVEDYDDWFLWTNVTNYKDEDEKPKPSNWQRIGGPPGSAWNNIEEKPERGFFYAQFSEHMPDFNLRNENVTKYLESVMKFWLDLSIDGFRIDAISHGFEALPNEEGIYPDEDVNPAENNTSNFNHLIHTHTQDQPELFDLIYSWRKFLDDYQVEKNGEARIIMTESYSSNDVIKKYYLSADGKHEGAHLPFNFQMINKIKANSNATDFVDMVTDWLDNVVPPGKVTNWVIGNHDQERVATRFGIERVDILNTLVTMLPGTSVTYYGEEIGMEDSCAEYAETKDDPATKCDTQSTIRTSDAWHRAPMAWDNSTNGGFSSAKPWMPASDKFATVNVKAQEGVDKSHLEIHRQLLHLRKEKAFKESDKFDIKTLNTNSFAFIRELDDKNEKSYFVIINFGGSAETVDIKSKFPDLPDTITVEITGGVSEYAKDEQIYIGEEFELKKFESIVAFYNSSMNLIVSKILFMFFIIICVIVNLNF